MDFKDHDVCPTENVPLNTSLPELMPSELLVAMTSIDCVNSDSLADISSSTDSSSNQSTVLMTTQEANNNETFFITDNLVQCVLGNTDVSKVLIILWLGITRSQI